MESTSADSRARVSDVESTSVMRRRARRVAGLGLLALSLLAVSVASWVWTDPAARLVDCERSQSPLAGTVALAAALSAVSLGALLGIRWLLGRDAAPLLTAHRWVLPGLALLGMPLLTLFVALGADRPSCGRSTLVSLALSLVVYLPVATVMVPGYRGVRSPDVARARRAAQAGALFVVLWGAALLVLHVE